MELSDIIVVSFQHPQNVLPAIPTFNTQCALQNSERMEVLKEERDLQWKPSAILKNTTLTQGVCSPLAEHSLFKEGLDAAEKESGLLGTWKAVELGANAGPGCPTPSVILTISCWAGFPSAHYLLPLVYQGAWVGLSVCKITI